MLFKEELRKQILLGNKTQTRRPVKDGERLLSLIEDDNTSKVFVTTPKGNVKWMTNRDYAVCYGRGRPTAWWHPERMEMPYSRYQQELSASITNGQELDDHMAVYNYYPFRIRINRLRREDVRDISHEDALAEGFKYCFEFWRVWAGFYDKPAAKALDYIFEQSALLAPDRAEDFLKTRPDHLYDAWVLDFELVGMEEFWKAPVKS